jgi:hypothetical protein
MEQDKSSQTPQPVQVPESKPGRSSEIAKGLTAAGNGIGRVAAPVLFVVFIAVIAAFAWDQVENLFRGPLGQTGTIVGIPVSHFAAAASVGMALIMLIVSKYSGHFGVAAGATIWAVAYIAVTFFLVFVGWLLGAASSGAAGAAAGAGNSEAIKAVVANMLTVMPFLPLLGSAAVIILAGMGLACFGTLIGTSKNPSVRWDSENRARSHLVGNLAKIIVTLASVGFSIWFGVTVLGVNAALAAVLGLVLDIGLINSWMKAEAAAEDKDWREARRWKTWAFIFGGAVALMAFESIGTQFKTQANANAGAISPQLASVLSSDLFGWMQTVGAFAIIGAIALSIVQLLLTMRDTKSAPAASADVVEGEVIGPRQRIPVGNRVAGAIRAQRAAWSDAGDALAGRPPAQLEAPSTVMGSDSAPSTKGEPVIVDAHDAGGGPDEILFAGTHSEPEMRKATKRTGAGASESKS